MGRYVIIFAAIALPAGGVFALDSSDNRESVLEIHRCTNNPFTRAVGILGGRQPEIFLKRPDLRNQPPPQIDSLTKVLDVSRRNSLSNPTSDPIIDKCASSFRWDKGVELVILTVYWDERNCTVSGSREEPPDCRGRAAFGFSLDDLGIREFPDTKHERRLPNGGLGPELIADVYFTQQTRPRIRRTDTGLWMPATTVVHLVVKAIPPRAP